MSEGNKVIKGNASQYYVAAELSRRGVVAALTLANCPHTDILCSNVDGTRTVHVQVKTFTKGAKGCAVGQKAEKKYGPRFFWVLVGIPSSQDEQPVYYIIPASAMAKHVAASFKTWCDAKKGHDASNKVRVVRIPPKRNHDGWSIRKYKGRWDLILKKLEMTQLEQSTT